MDISPEPQRPDPEALLARVRQQDSRRQRGRLKIFFGAAPGVGKTYSLLQAAQVLRNQGVDVVAGYVEPHARPETSRLLEGLEQLPTLSIDRRGLRLQEFDLDAALRRRATLTLVDELAHSNLPGARHRKRWQDIEEMLAAGLDVWTTLNVQHLESLNDVVAQITGVRVRETLPDHVFEAADEVELIDLPPDDLIARLAQGRVYIPEQASRASQHFFRKGNLTALRELALRAVADRVDSDVRDYRDNQAIAQVWQVNERVMVCLGPGDHGESLVRAGKRMATRLRAPWSVVYVETPRLQHLSEARRESILHSLSLAETLGAEASTISGQDIADTLLAHARNHNATRLLLGRPRPRGWLPWRRSPLQRLAEQACDLDIVLVAREASSPPEPVTRQHSRGVDFLLPQPPRRLRYLRAAAITALCTVLVWPIADQVAATNIVMLYLVGTVWVSLRFGSGPSALSAVLSVLAFDFFFVQPHMTFAVSDGEYLITFAVMLGVGLLLSRLTSELRAQARVALAREKRATELYAMSQELAIGMQQDYLADVAVRHITALFDAEACVLLPNLQEQLQRPSGDALPVSYRQADLTVAQWVFDNEQAAGLGTQTLPGASARYLPLKASLRTRGVLAIRPLAASTGRRPFTPEQLRLLETFCSQIAVALERVHFADVAQQTEIRMQGEQLRNHLLSAISHDLRTPLAAIVGTTSSLLTQPQLDNQTRTELLQGLHDEANQMSTLVHNLLDMARMEAGAVTVRAEWQPLEEVVGSTLAQMERQLRQHPLRVTLPPDLPWIQTDSVLLERVLVNLLDNACKYTPTGSSLLLSANVQGPHLEIRLRDHGPGLPPGQDVFGKFVRGQRESATPGAGLGLALCRAIMEALHGDITAQNPADGGTLFILRLPLGEPPEFSLPDAVLPESTQP